VNQRIRNEKVIDGFLLQQRSFPLALPLKLTPGPSPPGGPRTFFEPFGGGVMMTSLATALRGLLVTTTAVGIVAYLLLSSSHM
jgi:hypothetical protein